MNLDRRAMVYRLGGMLFIAMTGCGQGALGLAHERRRLPIEGEFPSLEGATTWLNTPRLSRAQLRGKVVLVDFWTYSCINWRRSLPYVRAWAEKYRHQGLVVIGAHAPEFQFETVIDNVRRAVGDMNINYPIAIDNQYQLWNGFENEFWPALYLIDAHGRLRYHHLGEGGYAEAERNIQYLLREAGAPEVGAALVSVEGSGVEASPDFANLKSPENYLGYSRSERFVSTGHAIPNEPCDYVGPSRLGMNHWALAGTWVIGAQSVTLLTPGGRIRYAFHARDLHLVMGPGDVGAPVRFRVTIDGHAPGEARGLDVDRDGNGSIIEPRMYQLVRQPTPVMDRQFEIEFLDPGAEAFSFTFG
jgi:thiol-disulfide isomerase/thioredoxin